MSSCIPGARNKTLLKLSLWLSAKMTGRFAAGTAAATHIEPFVGGYMDRSSSSGSSSASLESLMRAGQQSMKQFDDALTSGMGVEGQPATRDASSPFAVAANLQQQFWSPIVEFWKGALGSTSATGSQSSRRDRRFQDEAWQHSPYFQLIKKSYLMTSKQLAELA